MPSVVPSRHSAMAPLSGQARTIALITVILALLSANRWIAADDHYVPQPIPVGSDRFRWATFNKRYDAWLLRCEAAALRNDDNLGKPWTNMAGEWIFDRCHAYARQPNSKSMKSLNDTAHRLVAMGCKDPLVVEADVLARIDTELPQRRFDLIAQLYDTMIRKQYPPCERAVLANRHMYDLGQFAHLQTEAAFESAINDCTQALIDMMKYQDEDRIVTNRRMLTMLNQLSWEPQSRLKQTGRITETVRDRLLRLLLADPQLGDPWLHAAVIGSIETTLAWEARGDGWADSVTEAGWKGFNEHLERAAEALTKAWTIDPAYPEAPCMMITVIKGRGHDDPRRWFDRALAAQADYSQVFLDIYASMLPRWGGDLDDIERLGIEAYQTELYHTNMPMNYFEALYAIDTDRRDIDADHYDRKAFWTDRERWKRIEHLFGEYLKPDNPWLDTLRPRYTAWWAACLWYTGHKAQAHAVLDGVQIEAEDQDTFTFFRVDPKDIRAYVPEVP